MVEKKMKIRLTFPSFWVRPRKPDGILSTGASFDTESFSPMFGEGAANAYGSFGYFTGDPLNTDKGRLESLNLKSKVKLVILPRPSV